MKTLIAMMKHETNTFSPIITDWNRFKEWGAHLGDEIPKIFKDTRMPIAAYMKIANNLGSEIVTPLAAEAMPSGKVTNETFEYMSNLITDAVKNVDCILLDLHGAMVTEHLFDGEGELLYRIRSIKPDIPIAVTCDLHCNLTQKMIDNSTALIGYKTYPHTDMYEVAEKVGKIVSNFIRGKCNPVMRWKKTNILSQTLKQGTSDKPMSELIKIVLNSEKQNNVLASTIFGGFPMADIPDAGSSCVVVTDNDIKSAEKICNRISSKAWELRKDFIYTHKPLEETVRKAKNIDEGPVILLDHADNCGSGANQDVMVVIEEIIKQELDDVIVAAVWDPIAVKQMQEKGIGSHIELNLGGKTDMPSINLNGKPLKIKGKVKTLTDGKWVVNGPMYTGIKVNMGHTAVLDTGKVQIVIVSNHHEPWDIGVFTSVGIQPQFHKFILLKSRIHYRAGFDKIPKYTLTLDGEGVTTSDNNVLNFKNINRPIYPLDEL
ncbi:MAG: microcystin degradation protein MlrC [Rhodospirillaceae bacterium]|nr:microcystin degradation protein MlrC [Rhodospirillaceae bacterium]|tara:strand:- start:2327 stop:3793 length:1467 start_codon:yes stop_codon:yes gene_type:complete